MNLVVLFHRFSLKEPRRFQCAEIFLNHAFVLGVRCSVEQSSSVFRSPRIDGLRPSAAKSNQGIPVRFVKFIDHLLRLNVLRFCSDRDWRPVLIRTGHHQHSIAQCSLKPVLNVRWKVASCDVSEVQRPVGVRPGHANQDVFIAHANPLASCGWPMLLEVHA